MSVRSPRTPRPLRALLPPLVSLLPIAFVPAGAATEAPELLEVERPSLDNLETTVRRPVEEERRRLDELLDSGAPAVVLAEAFGRVGQLYHLHDVGEPAAACFVNAARLAPEDFRWPYFLGVLKAERGELEEAAAHFDRALELRPEDLPARYRRARVALDLGDLEAAEAGFEAVLAADAEHAAALTGLARVASERGEADLAIERYERALELQPEATRLYYPLGLEHRRQGDLETAAELMGRRGDGEVDFEDPLIEALGGYLRSAQLHFTAAMDALEADDPETAVGQLRLAVDLEPESFLYRHNLGSALALTGREDEAIAEYRRAIELNPDYRDSHYNLASLLAQKGELRPAAEHFRRAHELDPLHMRSWLEWAKTLAQLGERQRALEELELLLAEEPDHRAALLNVGTLEAQAGRLDAAEAALVRLTALEPATPEQAVGHLQLGRLHASRSDRARARRHFEAALAIDPGLRDAHLALGRMLGEAGRFGEAAEHFAAAVDSDPENLEAHYGRALALTLAERYDEARTALEASVAAHPGTLPLEHELARLLAAAPDAAVRDGERALVLARQVMDREPSAAHAETVAMALAELGRFDQAVEWQTRVVEESERRGLPSAGARRRLALYEQGSPARAPWLEPD